MVEFSTTTALFSWQQTAFDHIKASRVAGLFMDMGLGKTRTAFELMAQRQGKYSHVVWFTLVNLKETTRYELLKHTDIPASQIYTFDDKTRPSRLPSAFVYIVGLESMGASDRVVLSAAELLTETAFVVVDESSAIKGHMAKRTRRLTHLAQNCKYRLILTGTPLSQGVVDLYAQMTFLSPMILGYKSFYSFAANHLEYSEKFKGMIVRAHNTEYLAAKIAPYVYQCRQEDVVDLPEKIHETRYHGLSYAQSEAYTQAKHEILMDVEELDSYTIFRLFNALRQISSGFWVRRARAGEPPRLIKLDTVRPRQLAAVIDALPKEEKAIIWFEYQYSVDLCADLLSHWYGADSIQQYHGRIGDKERQENLAQWRTSGRFLLATTGTGGYGLTLNEAAYSVFYESQFKYSTREQAERRNLRIGTTRRPTYITLASGSGIEGRILQALHDKENAADSFKRKLDAAKGDKELIKKMIEEL